MSIISTTVLENVTLSCVMATEYFNAFKCLMTFRLKKPASVKLMVCSLPTDKPNARTCFY